MARSSGPRRLKRSSRSKMLFVRTQIVEKGKFGLRLNLLRSIALAAVVGTQNRGNLAMQTVRAACHAS